MSSITYEEFKEKMEKIIKKRLKELLFEVGPLVSMIMTNEFEQFSKQIDKEIFNKGSGCECKCQKYN